MNDHNLRLYLRAGLRQFEIRRALWIVERVFTAADALDELPMSCLEEVRDFCQEFVNVRRPTPFSNFKKAWVELVIDHLDMMRERDRRLRRGITGVPYEPDEPTE